MNANKLCSKIGNNQGSILVFVTLALIAILAVAALVIDFGFMYSNKGKLQHAADAGALAGTGLIHPQAAMSGYTSARSGAKYYAMQNFDLVNLSDNTSNNPGGDVVLGHWDSAATPKFVITTSARRVNAVKVVARRTGETATTGIGASSKFDLFIAKIVGINTMGAKSEAIAYRPPRARTYFMIGRDVCNVTLTPPNTYVLSPDPKTSNMAWTSLDANNTNSNDVRDLYFCPANKIPFAEVCGTSIFGTGGTVASIFGSVAIDFFDPTYDSGRKTFSGGVVTSWQVDVPVSTFSDPTNQPTAQPVWGYAELTIAKACSTDDNACNKNNRGKLNIPSGVCSGGENDIVISSIKCTPCSDSTSLLGAMPVLAK